MMRGRRLTGIGAAALGLSLAICGCTAAHYRASADSEVYGIVKNKTTLVPGMPKGFSIEQPPDTLMRTCPTPATGQAPVSAPPGAPPAAAKAPAGGAAVPPVKVAPAPEGGQTAAAPPKAAQPEPMLISLAEALEIAAYNSRSYQTQKETVYIVALTLTSQRYAFFPQPFGTAHGTYVDTGFGDSNSVNGGTNFGFNWLLRTGALITAQLTTDFSHLMGVNDSTTSSSLFTASITQPLLKGAGLAAEEPLVQAERDVVYQLRSFVQFRRQFFVQVLSQYYNVLENQQVIENQKANVAGLDYAYRRSQALSEAGQLPPFQVDQARQQLLSAQDTLLRVQQNYESSLDNFRITLGLPPETDIALDPAELARLNQNQAKPFGFTEEQAVELALKNRLDLMTANDAVVDAERKVKVAANGLLTGLDVNAAISSSTVGRSNPANFTTDSTTLSAGFELELPLSRLNERNTYRRSLITLEQNKRNQCQVRDTVVEDVRNTWRQLQRTASSYNNAVARVALAQRQVDSTQLLLQAGRAIVRDVLDAQAALLSAQNDEAAAIVDYEVARLDLAVNTDTLYVSETGQLKEDFDEYFRPQSK
jgi:outer membrane protein TolC